MDGSSYLDSGYYPPTPSYNGSYANSPFSAASELDFDSKFPTDEYDPAAYDNPGSAGLLTFSDSLGMFSNDTSHVAVSVTPALDDALSPQYYDHSSPASSNGGDASDNASSVSSLHHRQLSQTQSPHLNFTGLSVGDSPYMGNGSGSNAPSPPQLLIPDQRPGSAQAPAINAPEGNGAGDGGPRLHIVPATPISGTDPPQQAAFAGGSLLGTQNQASAYASANAGSSVYDNLQSNAFDPAPFTFPQPGPPQQQQQQGGRPNVGLSTNNLQSDATNGAFLIPPSPSRGRSKSDTSLPTPNWDIRGGLASGSNLQEYANHHPLSFQQSGASDDLGIGRPSSASALQSTFPPSHGVPQYSASGAGPFAAPMNGQGGSSPYLGLPNTHMGRPGHRRQAVSEDLRYMSNNQFLSADPRQTFLAPGEPMQRLSGHRRTSSGSRDRSSLGGSPRVSPYPSPSASPALRYEQLPSISGQHGMEYGQPELYAPQDQFIQDPYNGYGPVVPTQAGAPVQKVNVTTSATAEASFRRRTNDAKFACPVPGCGSTFTRHFNLKGHMRSHNDEKPFTCKWPGCNKGFARQHDCKRHEQLHSNHRPFTCEGCHKPFARLDALNRHLKSEGGAGCIKANEAAQGQQQASGDGIPPPPPPNDNSWELGVGGNGLLV